MQALSKIMLLLSKYRTAAYEYGYAIGCDDEDQAREDLEAVEGEIVEAIRRLFFLQDTDD